MQLRMYTDYALRALLYVGSHPDEPVASAAIARAYGISIDHMAKATKALTRAGVLRATRGAGGGVELARPPAEIRVGEVVRQFEGGDGIVPCTGDEPQRCRIERACLLRDAVGRAEQAFFAELDGYTLEDLLPQRAQLVKLLRRSERAAR
jgi:Rrf2 family transcriptional regulator, nitric oxide-sensitive transcriptional repressor